MVYARVPCLVQHSRTSPHGRTRSTLNTIYSRPYTCVHYPVLALNIQEIGPAGEKSWDREGLSHGPDFGLPTLEPCLKSYIESVR